MGLRFAVGTRKVEFGEERFETETKVDIAEDFCWGMLCDKVPGGDDIGEAEGERVI